MEASETAVGTGFITPEESVRPLVSIVVPAFNEAGRIAESIRKIHAFARESTLPLELIVVDDGSIDQTSAIVERLAIKGLRLIHNQKNHGKGYTVRQGVLAASGEYVLFTDAAAKEASTKKKLGGMLGRIGGNMGAPTEGSPIGNTLTNMATPVNSGLFMVTLDFGVVPFVLGNDRWLEIAVQEKASGLSLLRVHPRLDPIRSDARYWPLVRRVGLDDGTIVDR